MRQQVAPLYQDFTTAEPIRVRKGTERHLRSASAPRALRPVMKAPINPSHPLITQSNPHKPPASEVPTQKSHQGTLLLHQQASPPHKHSTSNSPPQSLWHLNPLYAPRTPSPPVQ